jgi:hypothetical protein
MLAGNLASIGVGGIVAVVVSLIVSLPDTFVRYVQSLTPSRYYYSGRKTMTSRQRARSMLPCAIPRRSNGPRQKRTTTRRKALHRLQKMSRCMLYQTRKRKSSIQMRCEKRSDSRPGLLRHWFVSIFLVLGIQSLNCLRVADAGLARLDTVPALRRTDDLWRARLYRLDGNRHYLDLRLCFLCRAISAVGE